jgi:hypothetical protein
MQIPAKVIDRIVKRYFPFRGQDCFVMSCREFERRWSNVLADFAAEGYPGCGELLDDARSSLESMRARPPEDFISTPPKEAPITVHDETDDDAVLDATEMYDQTAIDEMRPKPEEKKFRWREVK